MTTWPDPNYKTFTDDPGSLLFVYGSLLPGCPLFPMISPAVDGWVETQVDDYEVMLARDHSWFPYLVANPGKAARGVAFAVNPGRALASVVSMEHGAGYSLQRLTPAHGVLPDRSVWGFVYPEAPSQMRSLLGGVMDWRLTPLASPYGGRVR